MPLEKSLAHVALKHYDHNFGGVLGIYVFFYLGYFGSAIIAGVVAYYYRLMAMAMSSLKKNRSFIYVISVYVSATTIRWYVYSPSQLLRGVFLLSLTYYFYFFANKILIFKKK